MIDLAYAMPGAPGQGGGNAGVIYQLLPMLAIIGIFYFLLIRPQQKKAKDHQNFLSNLKKGDSVITQGGILGKVASISDTVVTLEIADKVRIRVSRPSIAGKVPSQAEEEKST